MWGKPRRVRRAQVSKEQVGEDNTKSQYWRKDRGEKEGDREERVTERESLESFVCFLGWKDLIKFTSCGEPQRPATCLRGARGEPENKLSLRCSDRCR